MSKWTPAAVTKMVLRLGSFGVIAYMLVLGQVTTGDLVAIAGGMAAVVSSLVPDNAPAPQQAASADAS